MQSREIKFVELFDGVSATGQSVTILCSDHRNVVLSVGTSGNADMVIEAKGAIGNTPPDFSAAGSETNQLRGVLLVDLQDNSIVPGDTGIVYSGTDAVRLFEVNTNAIDYLVLDITTYNAGQVSATARLANNQ